MIVYGANGYRAAMGVEALHLLGYEDVLGFTLGFQSWARAGEVIETVG